MSAFHWLKCLRKKPEKGVSRNGEGGKTCWETFCGKDKVEPDGAKDQL